MRKKNHSLYCLQVLITCFISLTISSAFANDKSIYNTNHITSLESEDWYGNILGKDEIVLPGFEPISANDRVVELCASRRYEWKNTLFPTLLSHHNKKVAGPLILQIMKDGQTTNIEADNVRIKNKNNTSVVIEAKANYKNQLDIIATTNIEYDGLAMTTIELKPKLNIVIDNLRFTAKIKKNNYSNIMAFKADTIRARQKELLIPFNYKGKFLNVVSIVNGNNSFWWFADNAKGWVWNSSDVTDIYSNDKEIVLVQNLIGSTYELKKPMQFSFNYIITPVKQLKDARRTKRIARKISSEESEFADYHLWWTTAFAHQNLPYTDYPQGVKNNIPMKDIEVYPGLTDNISLLNDWRKIGIERIPYFSAHVLSEYDPIFQKYKPIWEVRPSYVMPPKSDKPFTVKLPKTWLSMNSPGYADYLIYRFDKSINELGMQGLYFDQGGVIQSDNEINGMWVDSNGSIQSSTDILAMRNFFKRLATLFYLHGKEGLIFVHNSMIPVVPAYTFITAMVEGEEFIQQLKGYNYAKSSSIEDFLVKFSPDQYGIDVVWLSELWNYKVTGGKPKELSLEKWQETDEYIKALRGLFGLALLHDTSLYSLAPLHLRKKLYGPLDKFEIDKSTFHGYWEISNKNNTNDVFISYYQHNDKNKILLIIFNKSDEVKILQPKNIVEQVWSKNNYTINKNRDTKGFTFEDVKIPPNDYVLIETAL